MGDDWRTVTIEKLRSLILMAEPDIVEEAKWRKASNPDGVPTFSCAGLVCTLETYKDKVKLTLPTAPRWTTRPVSSMRALMPARDVPSMFTRATCWMRAPSSNWSGRQSPSIGPEPADRPRAHRGARLVACEDQPRRILDRGVVVEVAGHDVAADASGGQFPGDGCSEADSI